MLQLELLELPFDLSHLQKPSTVSVASSGGRLKVTGDFRASVSHQPLNFALSVDGVHILATPFLRTCPLRDVGGTQDGLHCGHRRSRPSPSSLKVLGNFWLHFLHVCIFASRGALDWQLAHLQLRVWVGLAVVLVGRMALQPRHVNQPHVLHPATGWHSLQHLPSGSVSSSG